MAHPLTQHPPNMIGFGAPATMSPLGFGFGQPGVRPGVHGSGIGFGYGFGSPAAGNASASASTPLKRHLGHSRASPAATASPVPIPAPHTPNAHVGHSTKRSRRASSSPSSSPSPLGSPSLRRENLADDDGQRDRQRRVLRTKRLRKEGDTAAAAAANADGPDVGVLLASFPPQSHLPILLELLAENPSLAPRVLRRMPHPPLANCLEALERTVIKIGKAAGSWDVQQGYVATRRWGRAESLVSEWVKSASTYLKFFTAPPPSTGSGQAEPNTIFHLLHDLTAQITQLLALIPAEQPPAARPLLELANVVLTNWNNWLSALSEEVNQRGGMYPHPMVQAWADGLQSLSRDTSAPDAPTAQAAPSPLASWASPMSLSTPAPAPHPLVDGFRQAIEPVRERFVRELGWLAGQ